jgi:hypothetical protein
MLRAGALVCGACGSPISAPSAALGVSYSQLDGQRPPGVGRVRYLRAWRLARDEHAPAEMVWSDGRARLMTRDAWVRWGASTSISKPKPPPKKTKAPKSIVVPTLADEVLDALGAERAR